jgi:hypothetical protein
MTRIDPDPFVISTDPQHWVYQQVSFSGKQICTYKEATDLNLVRFDLLQTDGQALLDEVNPVLLHVVSDL